MGQQCGLILSYFVDHTQLEAIENQINKYFEEKVIQGNYNFDNVSGDRGFVLGEMSYHVLSMKDWGDKECLDFIKHLKTKVDWGGQEKTVQVYYCPAHYDSPRRFRYVDFENLEVYLNRLRQENGEDIPEEILPTFKNV